MATYVPAYSQDYQNAGFCKVPSQIITYTKTERNDARLTTEAI